MRLYHHRKPHMEAVSFAEWYMGLTTIRHGRFTPDIWATENTAEEPHPDLGLLSAVIRLQSDSDAASSVPLLFLHRSPTFIQNFPPNPNSSSLRWLASPYTSGPMHWMSNTPWYILPFRVDNLAGVLIIFLFYFYPINPPVVTPLALVSHQPLIPSAGARPWD
ncbi:jg9020 [Pararge aegeria aegeria]|uniref:Jg9020 protein n=1 Tax=Pararge aegeria aegeria TaxID=348720 RepID=A0A8S4QW67_9NEOP|nr:jg9020 [Pararge aegeria aegeria]